jgi:hypothetical protein
VDAIGTSPEDATKNANLSHNPTARAEVIQFYSPISESDRVIWTDRVTGKETKARKDMVEKLPQLLKVGEEHARHVGELLSAMGIPSDQESASRQLRDAKEYLIQEKDQPICSLRSQVGGYFFAKDAGDLLKDAKQYRRQSDGMIRAAEALEALAKKLFGG